MPVKVLIVDDSALVRKILKEELSKDPDIEVVGTAHDPYAAREYIVAKNPDVITLDIEMPKMDGITFLKKLMASYPVPVIIVSSLTPKGSELALEGFRSGALDVLCKPGASYTVGDMSKDLAAKIKEVAKSGVNRNYLKQRVAAQAKALAGDANEKKIALKTTDKVIVIGASTGGTQALEILLTQFPANAPGTVIVQHMPEHFTAQFANRLDGLCNVRVREAQDEEHITPGTVLIAPGNRHMQVKRSGAFYSVRIIDGPQVCRHRPSVDVLFRSAAKNLGPNALGVMLTGMGDDGAEAMLAMKHAGATNIAQDESTSVVWGMPGSAVKVNAVDFVLPLDSICEKLWELL